VRVRERKRKSEGKRGIEIEREKDLG